MEKLKLKLIQIIILINNKKKWFQREIKIRKTIHF